MIRTKLSTLALATVLVLPLATAGCSKGSSPTEPAFDDELASASPLSVVTGESKGGGGGNSADDNDNNRRRRGRGGNDDKGDDDNNNRRRGRGGNGGNDDNNRPARNGREFEGAVASVGSDSVTLVGGLRILVNGGTQWSGRGDLFSLSQISSSLAAGNNPRVEGRGTRQADGSILASTIKAEHIGD
ncbi:MAG TPA: DUF5666 domain-containing protein [Thermoanaerobaculia bacterium]|jgi:hypothetical protein|nr:DUF5666 domain-containing protein [Thermoanaerobaculia bacterium]